LGDEMYKWKQGTAYRPLVTVYPNNLTLNIVAAACFSEVRFCMLGYDQRNGKIAIKPISKNEIDLKLVPLENLYRIYQAKSYSRISCKALIDEVQETFKIETKGSKFYTWFNEKEGLLEIDLNKETRL